MAKYKSIQNQFYKHIGGQINFQVEENPEIREFKYKKIPETQSKYYANVLQKSVIPSVDGYDLIDSVPRKKLTDILNSKLKEDSFPQKIRVIRPNHGKDSWKIFFKR